MLKGVSLGYYVLLLLQTSSKNDARDLDADLRKRTLPLDNEGVDDRGNVATR